MTLVLRVAVPENGGEITEFTHSIVNERGCEPSCTTRLAIKLAHKFLVEQHFQHLKFSVYLNNSNAFPEVDEKTSNCLHDSLWSFSGRPPPKINASAILDNDLAGIYLNLRVFFTNFMHFLAVTPSPMICRPGSWIFVESWTL